jgi:predicted RNA-binding protein with PUA-like domain
VGKTASKARKDTAAKPEKAKPKKGGEGKVTQRAGPACWLFKTEPEEHSWEMQKARGAKGEPWTGVRNFVARNNMKAMQLGDLGFFYHTGDEKQIVGVVEVCALAHPDPKDPTGVWKCVDVRAVCDMPRPVALAAAKANPRLANMALVRTARLSVQPVTVEEWREVCRMGGLSPDRVPSG